MSKSLRPGELPAPLNVEPIGNGDQDRRARNAMPASCRSSRSLSLSPHYGQRPLTLPAGCTRIVRVLRVGCSFAHIASSSPVLRVGSGVGGIRPLALAPEPNAVIRSSIIVVERLSSIIDNPRSPSQYSRRSRSAICVPGILRRISAGRRLFDNGLRRAFVVVVNGCQRKTIPFCAAAPRPRIARDVSNCNGRAIAPAPLKPQDQASFVVPLCRVGYGCQRKTNPFCAAQDPPLAYSVQLTAYTRVCSLCRRGESSRATLANG